MSRRPSATTPTAHALRVFKTGWVAREARRLGIAASEFERVARRSCSGLGDHLGGGVWKHRLCNNSCRALLLAPRREVLFFVYLFAKKDRRNIDRCELQRLRGLVRLYATYDHGRLAQMLAGGLLLEIPMHPSDRHPGVPLPGTDAVAQDPAPYRVAGKLPHARSHLFEAIHSAAYDLFEAGAINLATMRGFDRACLADIGLTADQIRAIRDACGISQAVFARCLGTSESTIRQWESGTKRPGGMARTLLRIIERRGLDVLS